MSKKIIVIGGVALGPKCACRCMRLDPTAEITLFDENTLISYGGCGIPYFVGGDIQNVKDLCSTPYQTLRDPSFFKEMKNFDVHIHSRVTKVDRAAKKVTVRDTVTGEEKEYPYDKLVFATGASPRKPDVPGKELGNIFTLTKLEAADAIRNKIKGGVDHAVVVGGGFIGLEAAVAMADMWGVEVSVVEMMPHILPGVLSQTYSDFARHDLESHGPSSARPPRRPFRCTTTSSAIPTISAADSLSTACRAARVQPMRSPLTTPAIPSSPSSVTAISLQWPRAVRDRFLCGAAAASA